MGGGSNFQGSYVSIHNIISISEIFLGVKKCIDKMKFKAKCDSTKSIDPPLLPQEYKT